MSSCREREGSTALSVILCDRAVHSSHAGMVKLQSGPLVGQNDTNLSLL